ncbi:MAG: hypothetical protein K2X82_19310 [Gemmataceae bacterium]|nr:hypothetical protein [Gemmataceae bacterium]
MPTNRRDWHARIGGVVAEFAAARAAADALIRGLERGDIRRPRDRAAWDVAGMSANLEGTYLIRLFAAFEAGLRSFWATARDTDPQTRDLIDAVASRVRVPDRLRRDVHEVREYRNGLIHERADPTESVALGDARSRPQQYFARLPEDW